MSSIGVNLRVTGHCSQGGRKYMEDTFAVAYQQTDDSKDLEYAYFGIFDGHGGPEAALYAKEHLIDAIVSQNCFWSDNDEDVLRAINDGYIHTHYSMWKHHETWPRTASGLPSTSGTTATVAFIRRGKLYIGHVGDSCIVLGYQEKGEESWKALSLTTDHKPETHLEITRIVDCGGKVITKSGVPRVVWNRPRLGHKGPVRRSTPIDEIPFLAVARALGDFWSYNSASNKFVVSPEPDVSVHTVDVERFRCLILGTDGLWNMLSPAVAVTIVQTTENHNEKQIMYPPNQPIMQYDKDWINPSKVLVDRAVTKWGLARQRADNTSVVTLLLDPPGPPKTQILLNDNQLVYSRSSSDEATKSKRDAYLEEHVTPFIPIASSSGIAIFTRYPSLNTSSESSSVVPFAEYANSANLSNEDKRFISNPKVLIKKNEKISGLPVFGHKRDRNERSPATFRRVSHSEPEISIANIDTSLSSSCEKRKHSTNSYNFRLKQKLRFPEKEDERNSDVENIEQWSQRWNELPSSTSQSNIRKSKSKRRRYGIEQDKSRNWSCSGSLSASSLDKSVLHAKQKSFQEGTTRILRSDTIANTPIRTLRSRNIDLSTTIANHVSSSAIRSRNEDMKIRNLLQKACVERSASPRTRCVRASSFTTSSPCPSNKKHLTKIPSFGSSAVTTRRSSSKRIVK